MGRKKQKKNVFKMVPIYILSVLSFFASLYCLAFAIECSKAAKDLDAYWETSYSGTCVEFLEFELDFGRGPGTDWYKFELDNGDVMADTVRDLKEAGLEPDHFEQLCGQPMEFAYTKLLRPFNMQHMVLGIRYRGTDLLSPQTTQVNIRQEAGGCYFIFGAFLLLPFLTLIVFLMDPVEKLCKKRTNRRNRKRKQEKKERYYAKQKQLETEKINSSKGDNK